MGEEGKRSGLPFRVGLVVSPAPRKSGAAGRSPGGPGRTAAGSQTLTLWLRAGDRGFESRLPDQYNQGVTTRMS